MIRLFSSHYAVPGASRHSEIARCLELNAASGCIGRLHLFLENLEAIAFSSAKLSTVRIQHRPTYSDFLQWAEELKPSTSDTIVIANSDIYFDSSIAVLAAAMRSGQCAALSRWDVQSDGSAVLFDRNDSQDAWVFKGPVRTVQANFPVGVPRCDNRFLYELKRAGYEVINPAFSVRAFHLHAGQRAEYQNENLEQFVEPPYAYLWPHNLWLLPHTLWHNFKNPDANVGWRLDRRRLARSLPVRASRKLIRRLRSVTESVD